MSEQALKPAPENKQPAAYEREQATVAPRIDILETSDELLLIADLPGVSPDQVDVRFENGELHLHGRRHSSWEGTQRGRWEYEPANFFRSFRVTEKVDASKIAAELKHGVLTVHLPKAESAKPRRIAVTG